MNYTLSILDRLMIASLLPEKANIINLRIQRAIEDKVGFTPEEIQKWNIRIEENQTKWNSDAETVEVEMSEPEVEIIREQLNALNKKEMLTKHHFGIYELFVSNNNNG